MIESRYVDGAAAGALLGSSWAITEQGRQQVIALITQALQGREASPLKQARAATVRDGVAIISITGPLFSSPMWCGCDYETILTDFNIALERDDVRAIVLDFDSPGGLTSGCHELAAAIFAARGRKPITAYVGGECCSAAYWIAAATDRLVASPTALVGSIGCYASLIDTREMLAKIGLKEYTISNDQSPFKVLDPSKSQDRDRVRAMVTQLASVFIADVAKYRSISTVRVESSFGKGDVVVGRAALAAGMIDEIGDFENVVTKMSRQNASGAVRAAISRRTVPQPEQSMKKKYPIPSTVRDELTPTQAAAVEQALLETLARRRLSAGEQAMAARLGVSPCGFEGLKRAHAKLTGTDGNVLSHEGVTDAEAAVAKALGIDLKSYATQKAQLRAQLGIDKT